MNVICIVSRWTGEHLGLRRFDLFARCAMEAWNKDMICSIPLMTPQSQYSAPLPDLKGIDSYKFKQNQILKIFAKHALMKCG